MAEEPELLYSSGRWIYKGKLLPSFNYYYLHDLLPEKPRLNESINKLADIKELENNIIAGLASKGPIDTPWPLPTIALEALKAGPLEIDKLPDVFKGLTERQAIIASRILYHLPSENECFWIIQGAAGSGKSTFLNLLCQLCDNDYRVCDPKTDLGGFRIIDSTNARIACCDDIQGDFLNAENIKKIATGATIKVEPKFGQPFDLKAQCHMVFLSNPEPYLSINDDGRRRRVIWYPRNRKIDNPNPDLKDYKYSHDDLLKFARCLLKFEDEYKTQEFGSWKKKFIGMTHEKVARCSSVYLYYIDPMVANRNYYNYTEWSKENGFKPSNKVNYMKVLRTLRDWKLINTTEIRDDRFDLPEDTLEDLALKDDDLPF